MLLRILILALCIITMFDKVNAQKKRRKFRTFKKNKKGNKGNKGNNNKYLEGTYEFEIMGRPHKLYLCDASAKGIKSLHWSIADVTNNEYTVGMYCIIHK